MIATDYENALNNVNLGMTELDLETQKREQFEEEVWCAHQWLDERGVQRGDAAGQFSLVGRMMRLAQINQST